MRYLSLLTLLAFVVPAPIVEKEKLPDLAGLSNWGMVTQDGRNLEINGHSHWTALGKIRADNTVLLEWIRIEDGKFCPGVYAVDGRDLQGHWGYEDNIHFDENGAIKGELFADRTYKLKKDPPQPNQAPDED